MKMEPKIVTFGAVCAAFVWYSLSFPAQVDFQYYAIGLSVIYLYGARSAALDEEKYPAVLCYIFWNLAYIAQIYYGFKEEKSNWPLFTGAYYLVNEFITCATDLFETPKSETEKIYVTPKYVRVSYWVFTSLDLTLNLMTIYFGTGSDYDELGIFPMETTTQRAIAFTCWFVIWFATLMNLSKMFGPRQAKYFMSAFQYVCQMSCLRLPVFSQINSHVGISNIMKLQVFGSAFHVVKMKAPCDPQVLFRLMFFFMSPFCAVTATAWYPWVTSMDMETYRIVCLSWLVGFWVVLAALQKFAPDEKLNLSTKETLKTKVS